MSALTPRLAETTARDPLGTLRKPVLRAIQSLEPSAEVVLFGSRARGTSAPDSDWDFLILVDGPVDCQRKNAIRHRLYDVEWEHDQVLSSIILDRSEWNGPRFRAAPLRHRIAQDGILL